ncbi:MAG: hypothetical protein ACU0AT_14365 [Tranquillimonas sp.]|jgi:hypothetical protein
MPRSTDPMAGAATPEAGTFGLGGDASQMDQVQRARLRELCEKTGEPFDATLTHRQANDRIRYLESLLK